MRLIFQGEANEGGMEGVAGEEDSGESEEEDDVEEEECRTDGSEGRMSGGVWNVEEEGVDDPGSHLRTRRRINTLCDILVISSSRAESNRLKRRMNR